jgi:beta-glucanase (GH16 family)
MGCTTNTDGFGDPKGNRPDGAAGETGAAGQSGSTLPLGGQMGLDAEEGTTSLDAGIILPSDCATGGSMVPTDAQAREAGSSTLPDAPAGQGGKTDTGAGGAIQNLDTNTLIVDAPTGGTTDASRDGAGSTGGKGGATGGSSSPGGATGGAGGATGGSTSTPADAGIEVGLAPDTNLPPDTSKPDTIDASPWHVVWSDEFNSDKNSRIDQDKWSAMTWDPGTVNNEEQKYVDTPRNLFHDGEGHLVLRALHEPNNAYPYTSARIQSKFAFKFGRLEIKAKLPAGKGAFPGMILMGTNGASWPQCGEIGLVEQYGTDKSSIYCSTYSSSQNDINEKVTFQGTAPLSEQFHVYALEWYEDHMVFFVDDVEVARRKGYTASSPFANANNDFDIILDVALGGNMGGTIDDTAFPMDMILDYVRVSTQ